MRWLDGITMDMNLGKLRVIWPHCLILGTEGKRRGWLRMRWLDSITDSMGMSLSKLQKTVKDWEAWYAADYGVTESNMT